MASSIHRPDRISSVYTLPSYEELVRYSEDPPTYDQAFGEVHLERTVTVRAPSRNALNRPRVLREDWRRKVYRSLCPIVCCVIVIVTGFVIYKLIQ